MIMTLLLFEYMTIFLPKRFLHDYARFYTFATSIFCLGCFCKDACTIMLDLLLLKVLLFKYETKLFSARLR